MLHRDFSGFVILQYAEDPNRCQHGDQGCSTGSGLGEPQNKNEHRDQDDPSSNSEQSRENACDASDQEDEQEFHRDE